MIERTSGAAVLLSHTSRIRNATLPSHSERMDGELFGQLEWWVSYNVGRSAGPFHQEIDAPLAVTTRY